MKPNGPPIEIRYRVWLQEGEMTGEKAAALAVDFSDPPKVVVTESE